MKTIALYGLQMLVGLVALAAGYAKLTGMGFVAEPLAMIGLGKTFLILAGTAEVLAGLCLLFPRSGVVGALLLATVMVGTMGASVGHAISRSGAEQPAASQTFRTAVQGDVMIRSVVISKSQGWDI
ncbi:MAG TPA: DoxX family protein [Xanthobacteraceae bacterium]|nr:DoxX family protein [Xanthobacteraceae bacterium]